MTPEIQAAYNRIDEETKQLNKLVVNTYPVGDIVTYTHGNKLIDAEIAGHSPRDDNLLVRGPHSGATYWIRACRVV
jgi:hypothetical protein